MEPTAEEILSDLAGMMYRPGPLSDLRESGAIAEVSRAISVVMLIVDLDTEVMMNGIANFLGNSTGRYATETVLALKRVGCMEQAALLEKIIAVAGRVGMTHDAIQQERSDLAPYTVTSFRAVHGEKWDAAFAEINELRDAIDFAGIWPRTEAFVAEHSDELLRELRREPRT